MQLAYDGLCVEDPNLDLDVQLIRELMQIGLEVESSDVQRVATDTRRRRARGGQQECAGNSQECAGA